MLCKKHQYFVLYRGDDTDFPGNQELIVELNTDRDLTGCSAHFSFQGFTQDFAEIPSDKKLRLVIPNSATGKFALGAADAKLWLTNGTKVRTVENRIHIVVTNRVDEAYDNDDPQAITVTISGGGGGATVVLDDTVTEESPNGVKSSGIWSWVKSLLPQWLTSDYAEPATVASVEAKFFPRVSDVESTDPGILSWGGTPVDQKLILRVGTLEVPELTVGRKKFTDKQDSINVVGILKGDGLGIISTATKSSTSSDPANADYRDPQDNTCHKTEVYWTGDYGIETGLRFTFSNFEGYLSWNDGSGHFLFTKTGETYSDFLCPEDWTGTAYVGIMGHAIESMATRHSVCTVGEKFVTSDVVDGKVSSAVSTNNPAFVSAVQNTPAPEPGQGEDPPWGTWGTVGAAIAGLVAGLKWLKDKVFDSAGNIQDQFATDLLGKQVAKEAIDERLPIPISEKSTGFTTESYKRFIVTVSGDMTVTLHTPTSGDAEIFECRFNGTSLAADASITFAGATATTMDANCGTVTAGKVALMSAFWNGATWDVNWKVEG